MLYTILQDVSDVYAPPAEPVLRVSVVGDTTFLAIGNHTESNEFTKFEGNEEVAVDSEELLVLLWNGLRASARQALRNRPED